MILQTINDYPEVRHIRKELLEAVWWTGVAISSCTVGSRAYARWKVFHRFFLDDAFVMLAWISFVTQMCVCQVMLPTVNELHEMVHQAKSQGLTVLPADAGSKLRFVERMAMACSFGFTLTIWSVKASFLIFFKKLGRQVIWQNLIWYCALAITVVGLITFFPVWSLKCAVGNMLLGKSMMLYPLCKSFLVLISSSLHLEDLGWVSACFVVHLYTF